jgi:hypothetical protein
MHRLGDSRGVRPGFRGPIQAGKVGFWFNAFLIAGGFALGTLLLLTARVLEPGPVLKAVLVILILATGILLVVLTIARRKKPATSMDENRE